MNTKIQFEIDINEILGMNRLYIYEDGREYEEEPQPIDTEKVIRDMVVNKISSTINVKDKVESLINDVVSNRVNDVVDRKMNEFVTEYFDKQIIVTDDYGEEKFKGTIIDRIKSNFDGFLLQKVNDKGERHNHNSYHHKTNTYTRIDFLINERLEKLQSSFMEESLKKINESMKTYVDKVDESVQQEIKNAVQARIGEKLYDNLDIGSLIENIKKS